MLKEICVDSCLLFIDQMAPKKATTKGKGAYASYHPLYSTLLIPLQPCNSERICSRINDSRASQSRQPAQGPSASLNRVEGRLLITIHCSFVFTAAAYPVREVVEEFGGGGGGTLAEVQPPLETDLGWYIVWAAS